MTARDKIHLESPHYVLRTLEPADASEGWTQWLNDAGTAHMLNAQARAATIEEIRAYIATFDGHNRHLLGVFEKDGGALVGIRALYVDWAAKEFLVNVLIGETPARGKGARAETSEVMYRHFFTVLGMEAARCSVLAHNAPILKVMANAGWEQIGTSYKPAVAGDERIELREFRLARKNMGGPKKRLDDQAEGVAVADDAAGGRTREVRADD